MPELGSVLQERYQLKEQLSDNPARETWLGEDLISDDRVVVKLLLFGGQKQWDHLKLFEREAKVLQNLDHPRIPRYRDYFVIDEQKLWSGLVQDYIPGSSLMDLLEQGKKFTEGEVRQIAIALLNILTYLHELNPPVLHRDIKPSNVILGEDEQVYLVDFGAVQDRAAVEGRTFTVVGTYGYTPLEQFGGQSVPASDLYGVGATLIHLLTGTAPANLLQKDLRIEFRDRVSTNLSPYFISWLQKLTEPMLEKRFSAAREAISALESGQALSPVSGNLLHPDVTCIQVNESVDKLEIRIPEPGLKILEICGKALDWGIKVVEGAIASLQASTSGSDISSRIIVYLIIAIGSVSVLSVLLKLTLGIIPFFIPVVVITGIVDYFDRTELYFDRNRNTFEIARKRLGFTYRRQTGVASEIQDVSIFYDNKKFLMGINITAASEPGVFENYSFGQLGRKFTEEECVWLAQEIRDWLGIKSASS